MRKTVTVGQVFGELDVIERSGSNSEGRAVWVCRCSCGGKEVFTSKQLTTGVFRACRNCQDSGSKSPLSVRLRKYEVSSDGCWNWTGKQNELGYGAVTVDGKYTRAHRAMFFMLHPDADRSLVVMHKCDNPSCVNPAHLQLGTQKENMVDMHTKGRFRGGAPIGNQNAKGNQGWKKGGIIVMKGYVASKLGDEVEIPEELK
jgi:hypothetical protein